MSSSEYLEGDGRRERGPGGQEGGIRIGVMGGGIGGMALALACQRLGKGRICAEVFERDESFDARSQGYGLTMQQGIKVLNALQVDMQNVGVSSSCHFSFLPDGENIGCYGRDVRDLADIRCDGGAVEGREVAESRAEGDQKSKATEPLVCWKCKGTGQRLISRKKPDPAPCAVCSGVGAIPPRPACEYNVHLPRQKLRRMLMDGLLPGTVAWGHKFRSYEVVEGGCVRVDFEAGEHASRTFDVLVGCDGIYSGVRRQRLREERHEQKLNPLNVMVILGICHLRHPALDGKVFQTVDGETRIYCMPFDAADKPGEQQPTMWQMSYPIPPSYSSAGDSSDFKAEALRRCGGWHPPIPQLLEATSIENITGYPAYDRDVLEPERLREGGEGGGGPLARVTLLGDAVHPMRCVTIVGLIGLKSLSLVCFLFHTDQSAFANIYISRSQPF